MVPPFAIMRKTMTPKQIAANRRNARKSTGPQTPEGQAVSKLNALKHGLRSKETVVRGRCIQEDEQEFAGLHQRLWEDLNPGGVLEEMLVHQIVTTHWRLRRALKAESGEIALSVDEGQWDRSHLAPRLASIEWEKKAGGGAAGGGGAADAGRAGQTHALRDDAPAAIAS